MGLWLSLGAAITGLSAGAVSVRAQRFPADVPQPVRQKLESFMEPGITVWWFTLGGAFQAYPSSGLGYAAAIGANTVFWLLVGALLMQVWRRVGRRQAP